MRTVLVCLATLMWRALSQIITSAPAACPVVIGFRPNQMSNAASHWPCGTWVVRQVATGWVSVLTWRGRPLPGEQVPQLQPRRMNGYACGLACQVGTGERVTA